MKAFTACVKVTHPLDPSGKSVNPPFQVDINNIFRLSSVDELPLLAGTSDLSLDPVPTNGFKGILIMLDPTDGPGPITVEWTYKDDTTGGAGEISASTGAPGVVFIHNANPNNGIVAVTITRSTPVTLRVMVFG